MSRAGFDRRRSSKGFTLIELMVAISIAGFTVAGLYGLFTVQSRQFITQDMHMEIHQNLRFATDMITRSVRMAGYGSNAYLNGAMGPNGTSDQNEQLPVIISHDDPDGDDGPDAITVVYADPSLMIDSQVTVIENCATSSITFRPNAPDYSDRLEQYSEDELLMCFDYADMRGMATFIWSLSSDPDTSSGIIYVDDNSSLSDYSAACPTNQNLTPVLTCSKANIFTFYIDDDSTSAEQSTGPGTQDNPVLMLDLDMNWPDDDDIPLVDNIEDLQFEYCINDDPTEIVDCSNPDHEDDGGPWTDSIGDDEADDVWMVRVSLIARSSRGELRDQYESQRPDLANRSGFGSGETDHFFRQVLSTEVTVRNVRYQSYL